MQQSIPQTDEEVIQTFEQMGEVVESPSMKEAVTSSMVNLYKNKRGQGMTVAQAYEHVLKTYLGRILGK